MAEKQAVLVVEDDRDIQMMMTVMLKDYVVFLAATADQMREQLSAHHDKISAILMDISLRGSREDGLSLTRSLRQQREWANTPIIAVTAHETYRQKALAAGCDGFLVKPVSRKQLCRELEEVNAAKAVNRGAGEGVGGTTASAIQPDGDLSSNDRGGVSSLASEARERTRSVDEWEQSEGLERPQIMNTQDDKSLHLHALRAIDALLLMLDRTTGGKRQGKRTIDPTNYDLAMVLREHLVAATGDKGTWREDAPPREQRLS